MGGSLLRLLIYASNHGWGHAARQRELVRLLHRRSPGMEFHVASGAPRWFWQESRATKLHRPAPTPLPVDVNGDVDQELTRQSLLSFHRNADRALERERRFVRRISPDLLVADADPLAVMAGTSLGIPSYILSNFTWDWIHRSLFPDLEKEWRFLESAYSGGTYLRLPLGPEHSPCGKSRKMPLLPAGPPGNPDKGLALSGGRSYALLAFREPPPGGIPEAPGMFTVAALPENTLGADLCITPADMRRAGASFADLITGASLVLCKAGYGILSQLLAEHRDAVVLGGRRFPEEPYLMSGWNTLKGLTQSWNNIRHNFLESFISAAGL